MGTEKIKRVSERDGCKIAKTGQEFWGDLGSKAKGELQWLQALGGYTLSTVCLSTLLQTHFEVLH